MARFHMAVYGTTKMLRGYCPVCKAMALIVGDEYQCCDTKIPRDFNGLDKSPKRMVEAEQVRRRPSKQAIRTMLEKQENKCAYCEIAFGTPFIHPRTGKLRLTKVCYDHFIPYAYSQDNRDINFVCACSACNGIKSDKIFKTIEEARDYVRYRRAKKGYDKAFAI